MPPADQRNRILGAMSQKDTDSFFSDLHPVSWSLREIVYEVCAPLEHVYFVECGIVSGSKAWSALPLFSATRCPVSK
jgi:hypothetical protein